MIDTTCYESRCKLLKSIENPQYYDEMIHTENMDIPRPCLKKSDTNDHDDI